MQKLTVGLLFGIFSIGAVFAGPAYLSAQEDEDEDDEGIFIEVTVDLKINGSDGPVTVAKRNRIIVQWTSEGADSCKGNWNRRNLKESGRQRGRISKSRVFTITCIL